MKNWVLSIIAALTLAGPGQAATLGLSTMDPSGSGAATLDFALGALLVDGVVDSGDAGLFGLPLSLIADSLGADLLFDIDFASVVAFGWSGTTLEFQIDTGLPAFSSGALLTVTSSGLTNLDNAMDVLSYFETEFGGSYYDPDASFTIAALAPIPLPASLPMLLCAVGGLRLLRRYS